MRTSGRAKRSVIVLVDALAKEQANASILRVVLSTGLKYLADGRSTRTQSSRIGLEKHVNENAALSGLPVGASAHRLLFCSGGTGRVQTRT